MGSGPAPGIWVTMETGPRVTTNTGWNFSVRSQATEEWESSGKFFCLFFTRGCGGSTGGSGGAPNKRSLPGTPTESQRARFSRSLCLHLIPFIIYSPPRSTKHCTGSKAAPEGWRCTADPCLSGRRAAPKSQSLRTAPSASSQFSLTTALRPGGPGPHFTQGVRKFREPKSEGGLPNPAHPPRTRPSHL